MDSPPPDNYPSCHPLSLHAPLPIFQVGLRVAVRDQLQHSAAYRIELHDREYIPLIGKLKAAKILFTRDILSSTVRQIPIKLPTPPFGVCRRRPEEIAMPLAPGLFMRFVTRPDGRLAPVEIGRPACRERGCQ